jgi:hypothetical protein
MPPEQDASEKISQWSEEFSGSKFDREIIVRQRPVK